MEDDTQVTNISSVDSAILTNNSRSTQLSNESISPLEKNESLKSSPIENDYYEDPTNTSNMVTWSDLPKIYSSLGGYGTSTCIMYVLIPKLSYDLSPSYVKSPVKSIVTGSDGTHLAACYKTNDVFLWDLNLNSNKFDDHDGNKSVIDPLKAILHITDHTNYDINGLGFVGERHTALIISDSSGVLSYHSAYRNHIWLLNYSTKEVLKVASGEKLLCTSTAPYVERKNAFHMVGVLTTTKFAIISTIPYLTTIFIENINKNITSNSFVNNNIAWNKNASKIAYSVGGTLIILELTEEISLKISRSQIIQRRISSTFIESILSLQWINNRLLGLLTISHQFLIIDSEKSFKLVSKLDLLSHNLMIPPDRYFTIYGNKFYLLTHYSFKVGKFMAWSDIVLNRVQRGDYIGALEFIKYILNDYLPIAAIIQLKTLLVERQYQLEVPFFNLALAAIKYILKQDETNYDKLYQLLSLVLKILTLFPEGSKNTFTNSLVELSIEFFDETNIGVFFEVLVNFIMEGSIRKLPASVFRSMLSYYSKEGKSQLMEELIITLDPQTLDVDLAVKLCQEYDLIDALIHIWTRVFLDFVTPFVSFISSLAAHEECNSIFQITIESNIKKVFDFLTAVVQSIQYPQKNLISSFELQEKAKLSIYYILFNGALVEWPYGSSHKLNTFDNLEDEPVYPYFNLFFNFNPQKLLSIIDIMFQEDSILNEDILKEKHSSHLMWVNRQYIMDMLVDIMKSSEDNRNVALLAIFISNNIPKYPQFIRFSNQIIENIIDILFTANEEDLLTELQLALESILTIYTPISSEKFIQELKEKKFNKVLFRVYNKSKQYIDLLQLILTSNNPGQEYDINLNVLLGEILTELKSDPLEHLRIFPIIENQFENLIQKIGINDSVKLFNMYDSALHLNIKNVNDETLQQKYLEELFTPAKNYSQNSSELKMLFVCLSCKYKEQRAVIEWLSDVDITNIDINDTITNLEDKKNYQAVAVLHQRLDEYSRVVEDVIHCIDNWFSAKDNDPKVLVSYMDMATNAAAAIICDEERIRCWSNIIVHLMKIYSTIPNDSGKKKDCNLILQDLFIQLAIYEYPKKNNRMEDVCQILTKAFENQDVILLKSQIVKDFFQNVFSTYNVERQMSKLILKIMEGNSLEIMLTYKHKLDEGWSIKNDQCEICGKGIWGTNISSIIFRIWQKNRGLQNIEDDTLALVVFKCHHGFHKHCLENLGQKYNAFGCLTCNHQYNK